MGSTSGAMYSGVPQNVVVRALTNLDRQKPARTAIKQYMERPLFLAVSQNIN